MCVSISEVAPEGRNEEILLAYSRQWEREKRTWGYRANTPEDFTGRRVFFACEGETVLAYLFGKLYVQERNTEAIAQGSRVFEVEELYVIPDRRSQGIGGLLFRFVEERLRGEADVLTVTAVAKDHRRILNFYMDELEMQFLSARLFKSI